MNWFELSVKVDADESVPVSLPTIYLKGRYQVNLQEKINHNQTFSEFSQTEAITLKKVASFFQDTIHFHPGHLQPKTFIFTIRALVE